MVNKSEITKEKLERIRRFIDRFSYIDLVIWRNEMIACGEVNNRVFDLLNKEVLRRADEMDFYKRREDNKSK